MLNGQSPSNLFERVKKQAKNLLSLKKENKLQVENLSTAQEVMAQVNGYPNWHAFQTHITNAIEDENASKYPQLKLYPKGGGKPFDVGAVDLSQGSVTLFLGAMGTGKSTISKEMLWNNVVNRSVPLKTALITIYPEQRDELRKINQHKGRDVALEVDLKKQYINLFDLPLGFVNYSDVMVSTIYSILKDAIPFNSAEEDYNIFTYISHLIFEKDFVAKVNKPYQPGICEEIDRLIKDGVILHNNTWKDLSYRLLVAKQFPLARKAARLASPVADDFYNFALENLESSFGTLGNKIYSTSSKIEAWLLRFKNFFNLYREFGVATNFDVQSYDLLMFSTQDYYNYSSSQKEVFIFLNSLILNFIKNSFFCKYAREYFNGVNGADFPNYSQKDWENTLNRSMAYTLRSYAFSMFELEPCALICDEFDRYDFECFLLFARESRKNNILVTNFQMALNDDRFVYYSPVIVHSYNLKNEKCVNQLIKLIGFAPSVKEGNGWVILNAKENTEQLNNTLFEVKVRGYK